MSFECLQEWMNHIPGQPVPKIDCPFREDIFPNIHSKSLLLQLQDISYCSITCYWENFQFFKVSNIIFSLSCLRGVWHTVWNLSFFSAVPQVYIGRTKITFTSVGWKKNQRRENRKCLPKRELSSENVCSFFFFMQPNVLLPKFYMLNYTFYGVVL